LRIRCLTRPTNSADVSIFRHGFVFLLETAARPNSIPVRRISRELDLTQAALAKNRSPGGSMKIGVIFPHDTIEQDFGAIKGFARAVEEMGFDHIISYDHVIGASRESRPDWQGPHDIDCKFYEPISLLSFIAAATSEIGLATGIMILPQRQTVLVAKQAATLDVLSNGRFRLGVGTGWNQVEYEALGMDFHRRGKFFDEQIDVLRALWTKRAVTIDMPMHKITDAGINPLPLQRPIPIWLGGGPIRLVGGAIREVVDMPQVNRVLRRIAGKADGWFPTFDPDDGAAEMMDVLRGYCREQGRDPATLGIEALLLPFKAKDWVAHAAAWNKLGASYMCCNTEVDGTRGIDQHIARLTELRQALKDSGLWTQRQGSGAGLS
jgi:probable F420-dependent oxidoreductase